MSIIRKEIENVCYRCSGTGLGKLDELECPVCKGTGIWKDSICYYIDDKKKICIDGEQGQ